MRILLVEDEAEHQLICKNYLEQEGHTVDAAATKDRALLLLKTNQYDVAAIDLVLVLSTGDTVAEQAYMKGLGVVLMTAGHEVTSVQDLVLSLELKGYKISSTLNKPFSMRVLLLALEQADRERKTRQAETVPPKKDGES